MLAISKYSARLRPFKLFQDLICVLHTHATQIRNKMHATSMASEFALNALPRSGLADWKHVTAMTAPVCPNIREFIESVGNLMVESLLIRAGLRVQLAETFYEDLLVTLLMAGVPAVRTLHASGILQQIST